MMNRFEEQHKIASPKIGECIDEDLPRRQNIRRSFSNTVSRFSQFSSKRLSKKASEKGIDVVEVKPYQVSTNYFESCNKREEESDEDIPELQKIRKSILNSFLNPFLLKKFSKKKNSEKINDLIKEQPEKVCPNISESLTKSKKKSRFLFLKIYKNLFRLVIRISHLIAYH